MAPKKAPPTPNQLAQQIEEELVKLEKDEAEELKYDGLIARNRARGLSVKNHEKKQFNITGNIYRSKNKLMKQMEMAEKMIDTGKGTQALDNAYEKGVQHLERDEKNVMMIFGRNKEEKERELKKLVAEGVIKAEKNNIANASNLKSKSSGSSARSVSSAPSRSRNSFLTNRSGSSISSANTSNSANSSLAKRRKTSSHANSLNSKRNFYNKVARQFIELKAKTNLEKAILLKRQGEVAQGVKTYVAGFKKKNPSKLKKIAANDQRYHIAQEFVGRPIHLHMANGSVRKFDALTNKMKKLMKQSPMKIHA